MREEKIIVETYFVQKETARTLRTEEKIKHQEGRFQEGELHTNEKKEKNWQYLRCASGGQGKEPKRTRHSATRPGMGSEKV